MLLRKILVAGILLPSMMTAASAANVVRPGVKAVSTAPVGQKLNLAITPAREDDAEGASQGFARGISPIAIIAAIAVLAAIIIIASDDDDEESSPGS